jgi:hypothetical protein
MSNTLVSSPNSFSLRNTIRGVVAAGALSVLGACNLTESDASTVAPRNLSDLNLAASSNSQGVILIGSNPCPEGGEEFTEPDSVVQDYVYPDQSENPVIDFEKLYAIRPTLVYNLGEFTAYCGLDFGSNGNRFSGNAVIIKGDTTIVSDNGIFGK